MGKQVDLNSMHILHIYVVIHIHKSVLALQRFVFIFFIDEREHSLTTVLAEATLSNEIEKVLLNQPIFWQ